VSVAAKDKTDLSSNCPQISAPCTAATVAPVPQAVFVAVKDKMDLSIAVALGSSIQIAVFLIPAVVLTGWATGKDFTLDFDAFAVLMLTGEAGSTFGYKWI
jgi:Ca2+/H+ antiporter